jgi:SAM-dependent methyltransferase
VTSSLDYYRQAHRIAFGPLTFQAVLVARDKGVLKALEDEPKKGCTPEEVQARTGLGRYAVRVLLEGCAAAGAVEEAEGGRWRLGPVGRLLLHDELVRVNMDFTNDVCYKGAFHFGEAIDKGTAAGLKVFGPWNTIYEGLLNLPPKVRESWLAFDHRYSDGAFPTVSRTVFDRDVRKLLDVGGNTGKWALLCLLGQKNLEVTILDHPPQLEAARANAHKAGVEDRLRTEPMDLLDHSRPFPAGYDVVWMSQLLDCFGEADVVGLLRRAREALAPGGRVLVLETYWDRQPNGVARDSIMATSLYFTCMANGNSRMYHSADLLRCMAAAGLKPVLDEQHGFHTLIACQAS